MSHWPLSQTGRRREAGHRAGRGHTNDMGWEGDWPTELDTGHPGAPHTDLLTQLHSKLTQISVYNKLQNTLFPMKTLLLCLLKLLKHT